MLRRLNDVGEERARLDSNYINIFHLFVILLQSMDYVFEVDLNTV